MIKYILGSLCLVTSLQAADWIDVPNRLLRSVGTEVNNTQGEWLYKSQSAGYYTGGGGVIVRSPVKSTQFATVSLPQVQAGCGGIDIYQGGFSFISGQQLVDALKSVPSAGAGYAFMLGLESVSPQISNCVRQMQSWANTINQIGINSCETAAQLVGSVWPANDMAGQHICRTLGTSKGTLTDYVAGRHSCSSSKPREVNEKIKAIQPLSGSYNLVWEALKAVDFFKDQNNNQNLAELYMTLIGTIIVNEDDGNIVPQVFFPRADDFDFLNCLISGGTTFKYKCADNSKQCLTMMEESTTIDSTNSWLYKIRTTLMNMQNKIINDETLSEEEKSLLSTTRLPLYKALNVLTAYRRGQPCPLDMQSLADLIAWDVLAQVINSALETIRHGCQQLKTKSMYSTQIDEYLHDLERVRTIVRGFEEKTQKTLDLEMQLIQKLQLLEKQIQSEIFIN